MEDLKTPVDAVSVSMPDKETIYITVKAGARHICLKIVDEDTKNEMTLAWDK